MVRGLTSPQGRGRRERKGVRGGGGRGKGHWAAGLEPRHLRLLSARDGVDAPPVSSSAGRVDAHGAGGAARGWKGPGPGRAGVLGGPACVWSVLGATAQTEPLRGTASGGCPPVCPCVEPALCRSGHLPLTAWAQPLWEDPGPPKSKDAGAALGGRWGTPRACTVISTREPGHTGVPEGSCLRTEKQSKKSSGGGRGVLPATGSRIHGSGNVHYREVTGYVMGNSEGLSEHLLCTALPHPWSMQTPRRPPVTIPVSSPCVSGPHLADTLPPGTPAAAAPSARQRGRPAPGPQ